MLRKIRGNKASFLALLEAIYEKDHDITKYLDSHSEEFDLYKTDKDILLYLINKMNIKDLSNFFQRKKFTFNQIEDENTITAIMQSLIGHWSGISCAQSLIDQNKDVLTQIKSSNNLSAIFKALIRIIKEHDSFLNDPKRIQQKKELFDWALLLIIPVMKRMTNFEVALHVIARSEVRESDGFTSTQECKLSRKCRQLMSAEIQHLIMNWEQLADVINHINPNVYEDRGCEIIMSLITAQEKYWKLHGVNVANQKSGFLKMLKVLKDKLHSEREVFLESHQKQLLHFKNDKDIVIHLIQTVYGDIDKILAKYEISLEHFRHEEDIADILKCIINEVSAKTIQFLLKFMENNSKSLSLIKSPLLLTKIFNATLEKICNYLNRNVINKNEKNLRTELTNSLISIFTPYVKSMTEFNNVYMFLAALKLKGESDLADLSYLCLKSFIGLIKPTISDLEKLSTIVKLVKSEDARTIVAEQHAYWKYEDELIYRWKRRIAFLGGELPDKSLPLFNLFARDADYVIRSKILEEANLGPKSWRNDGK